MEAHPSDDRARDRGAVPHLGDNGWFIFAVIRDPWTRLWSAWQSKFLVRHLFCEQVYGHRPWFPRVPEKPADVVEDWHAFIEADPWTRHPTLRKDAHFWKQVRSVRPDDIDYTRIYDVTEMPVLLSDLRKHLAGLGWPTELYVPRANETPLGLTKEVLGGGAAERPRALCPGLRQFRRPRVIRPAQVGRGRLDRGRHATRGLPQRRQRADR